MAIVTRKVPDSAKIYGNTEIHTELQNYWITEIWKFTLNMKSLKYEKSI